jgi:DHA2 family multidrug resistance protein
MSEAIALSELDTLLARARQSPYIVAFVVTISTFMEVLDTTIVNVSLPHIGGNLSAGIDETTWVLTSYLVSNAIILPISGWLSSVFGRKRFYMSCVALFTFSSMMCGLAPTLTSLIVFRVLQGLGGGGLQPSQQAILVDTFPREKLGMAFAVVGMATVLAPVIGPTLGGWITDNFSWRWIFFINLPVGIVSLFLTSLILEEHERPGGRRIPGFRVDWLGLPLVALGIGCLQVVLDQGQRKDWFGSNLIVTLCVISAVALLAAIVWEWRHPHPVVDLRLFRDRNFAAANVMMFMVGLALISTTVLLPLLLQTLMGYTATWAGLVLSPGGLVVIVTMPIVGMVSNRVQPRRLIAFGFLVTSLSLFHMGGFTLEMSFFHAMLARCFQTLGLAFLFIPINTVAYAFIPPEKNNNASALINVARNLGGSFGIAMVTTLLARRAQFHQSTLVANLSPYDPQFQAAVHGATQHLITHGVAQAQAGHQAMGLLYNSLIRQSTMLAYIDAFRLMAMATLILVPIVILVMKRVPLGAKRAVPAR